MKIAIKVQKAEWGAFWKAMISSGEPVSCINREFMLQYKEDLKKTFDQEEILITCQVIEVL